MDPSHCRRVLKSESQYISDIVIINSRYKSGRKRYADHFIGTGFDSCLFFGKQRPSPQLFINDVFSTVKLHKNKGKACLRKCPGKPFVLPKPDTI